MTSWTFTSESVTEGHPDKMADQISDAILDAMLAQDPMSRVACETLVTTGLAVVAGEITTAGYVDIPKIVRSTINEIGYNRESYGFDGNTVGVMVSLDEQSPDIAQGVDDSEEVRTGTSGEDQLNKQGAGDQGMMFGYACDETDVLMPLPIHVAHRMAERLAEVRKAGTVPYLRPDGKTQVTFDYVDGKPVRLRTVLISTQHNDGIDREDAIRPDLIEHVIRPVIPAEFADDDYEVFVNPTGRFVIGGPVGDAGLTGRKIIVDTYGGMARHGGGAFSGKDPSKVDRSAAYAARWVAKNVVAAGAAQRCEVQVAYAIGVAHPVSLHGRDLRHLHGRPRQDLRGRSRGLRPPARRHPPRPRPAPAALPPDRRLRPLRPHRRRLHLGAHRPGRAAASRPSASERAVPPAAPRRGRPPRPRTRARSTSARPAGPVPPDAVAPVEAAPTATPPEPVPERPAPPPGAPAGAVVGRVVRVRPDEPGLDKLFDYVVPAELDEQVRVGTVVRIALAGRRVAGWVVADDVEPPDGVEPQPLAKVTGWGPPPELLELADWAAWRWAGRPASLLRTATAATAVRALPRDAAAHRAASGAGRHRRGPRSGPRGPRRRCGHPPSPAGG